LRLTPINSSCGKRQRQQAIGVAILSVHVLPFVLNFNRVATIAIANDKTGLY
jgi:hypothetical protein